MNIDILDQSRINEISSYGEAVRLSNEIRASESYDVTNPLGQTITYPAKDGFDVETAPYPKFTAWLKDDTIRKSPSLYWFVMRIMTVRFETKNGDMQKSVKEVAEFELIKTHKRNSPEWFGEVGYFDKVKLSGK